MHRRTLLAMTIAGTLAFGAGCGGDDDDASSNAATTATTATTTTATPADGTGAAAVEAVKGGETRLEIDDTALRLLETAGVGVEPDGEARRRGVGVVFPVTGGRSAADGRSGSVEHTGGLRFSAAGRSVVVEDLVLDLGDGRVTGTVSGQRLPILEVALDPDGLDVTEDRISGGGLRTTAGSGVTDLLAEQLSVPGLPDGLPLGRVRFAYER